MRNSIYSRSYSTNLKVKSALRNLEIVKPTSVVLLNQLQTIKVNFDSLGDSCALIKIQKPNNQITNLKLIGKSLTCQTYFPSLFSLLQNENYFLINSNIWSFNVSFNSIGINKLSLNIIDSFQSINLETSITIVSLIGLCDLPKLEIINNKANLFYSPVKIKKSKMFSIGTKTQINCNQSSTNYKEWFIFKMEKSTGNILNIINLINNPTINYAELVIQPNTLEYGLYKFVYKVTMQFDLSFTSQVETYIEIVPSGIIVAALNGQTGGGTYEITRGMNQSIELNPVMFSFDLDSIVNIGSLKFKYYCQIIENGIEKGFPMLSYDLKADLFTIKSKYNSDNFIKSLFINNSQSCFDSPGLYLFSNSLATNLIPINM